MQTRIYALLVTGLALGGHGKRIVQELDRTAVRLLLIFQFQ